MAKDKPAADGTGRWGVFGGTFDPVHHGHLITAQQAAEEADLDRLLLVPSKTPPHRESPDASPEERLIMVERAVETHPTLSASDVEFDLEEPSYTYRTIQALRDNHPEVTFQFILGVDELINFKSWHRWEDLLETVQLLGFPRPDCSVDDIPDDVRNRVDLLDTPLIDISSTAIRRRIRQDQPIDFLVPPTVNTYIEEMELYRD